jgi:hypothetical protein
MYFLKRDPDSKALLIVNVGSDYMRAWLNGSVYQERFEIVEWTSEADNPELEAALKTLLSESGFNRQ